MTGLNLMQKARGFTLIEVIVAVAVIAVSFTALLLTLTSFSKQHIDLRNRFWTQNIAWNRAVNIQLEAKHTLVGRDSGEVDMLQVKWRWRVDVKETSPDLYRIDVDAGELNAEGYITRLVTFVSAPGK